MPTYQPHPPINLFQLQMQPVAALQHNLTPPGNEAFVTLHVPPLILRLDQYQAFSTGPHQDRAYQPERGRRKTAASTHNHTLRTSFSTIANDHSAISQHSCVGDFHNARNGSAGRPPSLGMSAMPNQKYRSRASVQTRIKRVSAIRGQRKCDDLLQYVVANNGAECMWDSTFYPLSINHYFFQPHDLGNDAEWVVSQRPIFPLPRHHQVLHRQLVMKQPKP